MESGLLRQRRNLIAISSLLIVYDFADIKVRQVGLMGTSIDVGNPNALSFIIWAVWAYFFLRYYQYWSSEKDTKVLPDLYELVKYRVSSYFEEKFGIASQGDWRGYLVLRQKRPFKWTYDRDKYDGANDISVTQESFHVPTGLLMWWSFTELAKYCFHKKHMSEHILPFALAIIAALIKIYSLLI